MKIKLKTIMSGPDGVFQPGDEIEVDPKRGRDLIAGNYAIELKSRRGETQRLKTPENAMLTPTAEAEAREHLASIAAAQTGKSPGGATPAVVSGDSNGSHSEKPGLFSRLLNMGKGDCNDDKVRQPAAGGSAQSDGAGLPGGGAGGDGGC